MGGYSDDGAVVAADAPAVDDADEEPALVVPERVTARTGARRLARRGAPAAARAAGDR